MNTRIMIASALLTMAASTSAWAKPGDVYIYPAKGQSTEQTEKDRYECYVWASKESGFDPSRNSSSQPDVVRVPVGKNEKQGAAIAGTIIGAIAGAAIGSHDANAGQGAVVGAAAGTMIGAAVEQGGQARAEAEARDRAEDIAREQAAQADRESGYRRAFSACLEGRGYVVR
ncbi:MAG: hypothetical protein KDI19_11900 [Pseudomonadales bacterium]|nr:hypothetical protein [Pseudomonadales bacterium]